MGGRRWAPRTTGRRVAGSALLAALPWTWFLLRGALGPVTDVLALLLPLVLGAVVAVAVAVALRRRRAGALVVAVSTLLTAVVAVAGPWLPADAGPVSADEALIVAAANVDGQDRPMDALRAVDADLWVVPELSAAVYFGLTATHPHELLSATTPPNVAVFSRYPLQLLEGAGPDLPGQRIRVDGPAGPFVLYALHVPRPWILGDTVGYQVSVSEHQRIAEAVAARVARETLPVVVAGDLNSTDRGRDYRALVPGTGLVDAMRAGVAGPTSVGKWRLLLARIDHVLVSPGWCGDDPRRVGVPGSSHRAVTVTVGPCAGP